MATTYCTHCREMMKEVVDLNHIIDTLRERMDVNVADVMHAASRKAHEASLVLAMRDQKEVDLRLDLVAATTDAANLRAQVELLNAKLTAAERKRAQLNTTVAELEDTIQTLQQTLPAQQPQVEGVDRWTQTMLPQHAPHRGHFPALVSAMTHTEHGSACRSPNDGVCTSVQGESRSTSRQWTHRGSSARSDDRVVSMSRQDNHDVHLSERDCGAQCIDESSDACALEETVGHHSVVRTSGTTSREQSASPLPTPCMRLQLKQRPFLFDGVNTSDLQWPTFELPPDDRDPSSLARRSASGSRRDASQASSVRSGPTTPRFVPVRLGRGTPSPCATTPLTGGASTPRGGVQVGAKAKAAVDGQPRPRPLHNAATYGFPATTASPPMLDGPYTPRIASTRHVRHTAHSRRQPLPRETIALFRTAQDGLHMLRGLTVRADAKMFLTMSSVHELKDCGCPLKQSLTRIKQILLGAMPRLAKKIRDGEQWLLQKRDLFGLQLEHTAGLATCLREMMVAHDYLRHQVRADTMPSVVELYLNIHIFVMLARTPAVQTHLH